MSVGVVLNNNDAFFRSEIDDLRHRVEALEKNQQQQPERKVTKFHSGLYILKVDGTDGKKCAADLNENTKQVEFTIPEGYIVQEIVLKEKK